MKIGIFNGKILSPNLITEMNGHPLTIYNKGTYNWAGVTSVRANRAVLIFSLKKKEACFLNSWKDGAPMLPLLLPKFDIFSSYDKNNNHKQKHTHTKKNFKKQERERRFV